jgi:hypothetical protein
MSEKKEGHTPKDAMFLQKFSEANFDPNQKLMCAEAAGLGTGEKALLNAGRVIKSLAKNEAFQQSLKRVGVDYDKLAEKLSELLDAESAFKDGKPDNFIRHKTLETAIRVLDLNPAQRLNIDKTERHEIVISADVVDRLVKYNEMRELQEGAIDAEIVTVSE